MLVLVVTVGATVGPTFAGLEGWGRLWAASGAAALTFLWVRVRWLRPLEETTTALRDFAQGDLRARADEQAGAREARLVASAANRALERVLSERQRHSRVDQAARAAAVDALRRLADGDLWTETAALEGSYAPVGQALTTARRGLRERTVALHRAASTVAEAAANLLPQALRLLEAAREQHDALERLVIGAEEAEAEMARVVPAIQPVLEAIHQGAEGQRNLVEDGRERLAVAARGAARIREAAERARATANDERAKTSRALECLAEFSSRSR